MLVHIVADYGTGDLAFAEVIQRIKVYLPDAEPMPLPVPAFSTLAAGFCIARSASIPRRPARSSITTSHPAKTIPRSGPRTPANG